MRLLPLLTLLHGAGATAPESALLGVESDAVVIEHFSREPPVTRDPCPTIAEYANADILVAQGHARHRNRARAIEEARLAAFKDLEARVCDTGPESLRCLAGRRHIMLYGTGAWRSDDHVSCASMAIPLKYVQANSDLDLFRDALATLGRGVAERLQGRPLRLVTPTWASSGCSAGELGAQVLLAFRQGLDGVRLVEEASPDATQLRIELAGRSRDLQLSALIREPGASGWEALPVPQSVFPVDLFGLKPDPAGACATADRLGLVERGTRSIGDPGIRLDAVLPDGISCEGEALDLRVSVHQPSRLRVFAVQSDGSGFQVWPFFAQEDRVYDRGDPPALPRFTASRNFDGSDTRVAAVAWPTGLEPSFDAGFCRLTGPFDARAFPKGVAIDTLAWPVLGAGERICARRGSPQTEEARKQAEASLAAAPPCRGR
jgi:hypothetical protein